MRAPSPSAADAHHHVVAEAHDRRARHRLDAAVASPGLRRARVDDPPLALGDHREGRVVGGLRRCAVTVERADVRIGRRCCSAA